MKARLAELVASSLTAAKAAGELSPEDIPAIVPAIVIEAPRNPDHGDFATNVAMALAKAEQKSPRAIAETICKHFPNTDFVADVAIAGPGFINFTLADAVWHERLRTILTEDAAYGTVDVGHGEKVLIEFVSANPTGPIHVGHGRNAAVGDSLARILERAGYEVSREHYLNDAGSQVDTLARSLHCRYLELLGRDAPLPEGAYPGEYVQDLATELKTEYGDAFIHIAPGDFHPDERAFGAARLTDTIRADLKEFRVEFDTWFSEKRLYEKRAPADSAMERALAALKAAGAIEEKDGAQWFIASEWNDDKDRVLIRATGEPTYFASDIAYHLDKLDRGWTRLINIWGADHHGYIPRVRASLEALKHAPDCLEIILIQMVNLLRGGKKVQMGKRAGTYVTLREVMQEVGVDAARFTYLTRSHESPLDFDLEAAVRQSADNPVYYVQYACARVSSLMREAAGRGYDTAQLDQAPLALLRLPVERNLIKTLGRFPDAIARAATAREPHTVARYLTDVAGDFHRYYNATRVLGDDKELARARLALAAGVAVIVRNGLDVLGVNAPTSM